MRLYTIHEDPAREVESPGRPQRAPLAPLTGDACRANARAGAEPARPPPPVKKQRQRPVPPPRPPGFAICSTVTDPAVVALGSDGCENGGGAVALWKLLREREQEIKTLRAEAEGLRGDGQLLRVQLAAMETLLAGLNAQRASAADFRRLERELAAAAQKSRAAVQTGQAAGAAAAAELAAAGRRHDRLAACCKAALIEAGGKLKAFAAERFRLQGELSAAQHEQQRLTSRCAVLKVRLSDMADASIQPQQLAPSGAALRRLKGEHGTGWKVLSAEEKKSALAQAGRVEATARLLAGGPDQQLVLSGCGLSCADGSGAALLSAALASGGSLVRLELAGCGLGAADPAGLSAGLGRLGRQLVVLDLSNNGFSGAVLQAVLAQRVASGADCCLTELRLGGNQLGTVEAARWLGHTLLPSCSALTALSLAGCFAAPRCGYGSVGEVEHAALFGAALAVGLPAALVSLDLAECGIGVGLLVEAKPSPLGPTTRPAFSSGRPPPPSTPPPQPGLLTRRLLELCHLRRLNLSGNPLGCAGARAVAGK